MPRRNVLPTLAEILKLTRQLRRKLAALLAKFPEDDIEPGERIFPRLLTHDWRHMHGVGHGPHSLKYFEASRWATEYHAYSAKLRDYCSFVLLKPELFPNLPVNGFRKPPAAEFLVLLDAQLEVLENMKEDTSTRPASAHGLDHIDLERLRKAEAAHGLKKLAAEVGCNIDTLRDALAGRTKPRRSTVKKLGAFRRKKNSPS
jgi:hypothetical protein